MKKLLSIALLLCFLYVPAIVHGEDSEITVMDSSDPTLSEAFDQADEELKTSSDWYLPMYVDSNSVTTVYRSFQSDDVFRVHLTDNLGFSKTLSAGESFSTDGIKKVAVLAKTLDGSVRSVISGSYYVPSGEKSNCDAVYKALIYAGVQPGFITIVDYNDLFEIE